MRYGALVILLAVSSLAVMGSFLSCEKIARPNLPPSTYFFPGGDPPDTLLVDQWTFQWYGTDLDSDVKGYDYRLLVGASCDSAAISADTTPWIRPLEPRVPLSFADAVTHPDGPYVFQARTEDEFGAVDGEPLTRCFVVSIQLAPACSLVHRPPGHQGFTEADFDFTARKLDRLGREVTATFLFSWTFSRATPSPELMQPWTNYSLQTTAHVTGLTSGSTYQLQVRAVDERYPLIESDRLTVGFEN